MYNATTMSVNCCMVSNMSPIKGFPLSVRATSIRGLVKQLFDTKFAHQLSVELVGLST